MRTAREEALGPEGIPRIVIRKRLMERDAFRCSYLDVRMIEEMWPEDISQMTEYMSVLDEIGEQAKDDAADDAALAAELDELSEHF